MSNGKLRVVTRHILEQTRRNSDDLAAIKSRLDGIEQKVDGLAKDLPKVVGNTMREVLRERGKGKQR
jgi:hypothetical protein